MKRGSNDIAVFFMTVLVFHIPFFAIFSLLFLCPFFSLGRILDIRLPSVRESLTKGIPLLRVSHWDMVVIP